VKDLNPFIILLSVVDVDYRKSVKLKEVVQKNPRLLRGTLELARNNGLEYLFLEKLLELQVGLPDMTALWQQEQIRLAKYLKSLKSLRHASDKGAIDYLLIKSANRIPHVPRDVDIFIRSEKREEVINLFSDMGLKCVQEGVAETAFEAKDYLRIDLYTDIRYVSVTFLANDYLWRSKADIEILGDKYWGLSAEADLLLTLVHSIIGHRRITLLDLMQLKTIKEEANFEACLKYAEVMGWGKFFCMAIDKISSLERNIYKDGEIIQFPYLFGRKFLKECIATIDTVSLGKAGMTFFIISLFQDEIIHKMKGGTIYNILRSSSLVRHQFNSITAYVKRFRGDSKSI